MKSKFFKVICYSLVFLIPYISFLFQGCARRATSLQHISLGMSEGEVIQKMEEPTSVRGSIKNKYGQTIKVWEYRLYRYSGAIEGLSRDYDLYWLYFVDGKLVQWGKAGDWRREADRIYEMRFR